LANGTTGTTTGTTDKTINGVPAMFEGLMRYIMGPVLSIIGIAAVIYMIMLGINYAKAEDADGRKKVQGRLIGAAVGVVIILAGVVLCFALPWDTIYTTFTKDAGLKSTISA
jgi:hypothetical protein